MLRTRLVTAAIALPALIAAIFYFPILAWSIFIAILGMWGLYEVASMTRASALMPILILFIFGMLPLFEILFLGPLDFLPFLAAALMILLVGAVGYLGPEPIPHGNLMVLLGALSVGATFPYFGLVRNGPDGRRLIALALLLVVITDSAAYFVGRRFGRHKLLPKVSPAKTIEGAIGGISGCIVAALILSPALAPGWRPATVVEYSLIVAILAILGDLANSAFKRVARVKDSGWIFPGHGGLLDRTCSLVLVGVLTYYFSQ